MLQMLCAISSVYPLLNKQDKNDGSSLSRSCVLADLYLKQQPRRERESINGSNGTAN